MVKDDYLTTGEVARILSISRSTVSRRFDSGLFKGKTNPITGERLLSVDAVLAFIQEHNLPIDPGVITRRRILLTSGDSRLTESVRNIARDDKRLILSEIPLGTDALVACSKDTPDLLILNDRIPDIHPSHVISSLRRRAELRGLRILCGLSKHSASAAAGWGADSCLPVEELLEQNRLRDLLYRFVGIPKEARKENEPVEHQRRWPRYAVDMRGKVGVYPVSAPQNLSWGTTTVRNVGRGGALLENIQLDSPHFPAEPFRLLLRLDQAPLTDWEAHCQVVRMKSNGALSAGVQFENLPEENTRKIAELASA